MNQENITRAILSGIIDRYTRDIAEDPNRSIRKLVDLGEGIADGPTQKIFYQMMRQMAANEESPYYRMIHNLVTYVSLRTIKIFGTNLGYNSWTFGARNIRKSYEEQGKKLPWTVLIDRGAAPDPAPFSVIEALIQRGRAQEIYAWQVRFPAQPEEWYAWTELFNRYADCAFALFIDPEDLRPQILSDISEIPNLMVILNTDRPDWQSAAEKLIQQRCLYAVYRVYNRPESIQPILDGSWMEELVPLHPLLAMAIAGENCAAEDARKVKDYIWLIRRSQTYPIMPADLFSDCLIINRFMTHQETLFGILPDGSVCEGHEFCLQKSSQPISELF